MNDLAAKRSFMEGFNQVEAICKEWVARGRRRRKGDVSEDEEDKAAIGCDNDSDGDENENCFPPVSDDEDEEMALDGADLPDLPGADDDDDDDPEDGAEVEGKTDQDQKGYQTEYWNFIKKYFPKNFKTFKDFLLARRFKKKLVDADLWDEFETYMNGFAVFTNQAINTSSCYYLFDRIASTLEKDEELFCMSVLVAKFVVPTSDMAD